MCGKGYYDAQRWGNSHHFCSVGKFAWLLERSEQEASRCAEMLITEGQACAHHDIIKHHLRADLFKNCHVAGFVSTKAEDRGGDGEQ